MSYILDALKKSEEKRGRHSQPTGEVTMVSEKPSGARRAGLALLFVALAGTVGWLLAQWQVADTGELPLANQAAETVVPKQPPVSLEDVPVDHAMEEAASASVASSTQNTPVHPAQHTIAVDRQVEQSRPVFTPVTPLSVVSRVAASVPGQINRGTDSSLVLDAAKVKSIFELRQDQSLQNQSLQNQPQTMPNIKIEAHIYDGDPRSRMVIINGKVRREKQNIGAGLVLQEITQDGVLIMYQGTVYHMGVFD